MPADAPAPDTATVLVRRQGRIGRLTLNRPKALNALDLPMVHRIAAALDDWREDPTIHAIVLDATGERAFCAGGDVRSLRQWVLAGEHDAVEAFFVHEYALNRAIARYPTPFISLIDGICMGGGIGLSAHGTVRVASEHAQFAMPETQVGLFPDVGATFALPRLRGAYGMYLALTSARVGGADATWLGLATHFVPRDRLATLADALARDGIGALAEAARPPPPGDLPGLEPAIACFAEPSLAGIVTALEGLDTDWSRTTLATLRAVSPSSLLWTFEIVRAGAARTFEQCQQAELELTRHVTRHLDFAEGVRAMVVDKDRAPRWSPSRLEDVDPQLIAGFFGGVSPRATPL
ncbi:MAG: enoyl-CoA hydratase/isomerase family protein [Acetobacteraceae bacterium]